MNATDGKQLYIGEGFEGPGLNLAHINVLVGPNFAYREEEREMIPCGADQGIGVSVFTPCDLTNDYTPWHRMAREPRPARGWSAHDKEKAV